MQISSPRTYALYILSRLWFGPFFKYKLRPEISQVRPFQTSKEECVANMSELPEYQFKIETDAECQNPVFIAEFLYWRGGDAKQLYSAFLFSQQHSKPLLDRKGLGPAQVPHSSEIPHHPLCFDLILILSHEQSLISCMRKNYSASVNTEKDEKYSWGSFVCPAGNWGGTGSLKKILNNISLSQSFPVYVQIQA